MKILHVITRLVRGGAQRNTLMCCEDQARRGHEVWLVSGLETGVEGSLWDEVRSQQLYRVVELPTLVREVAPVADVRATWSLWRLLRQQGFDLVHTHTSKAGLVGRLAARLASSPVVIHTPHGHVFHSYFHPAKEMLFRALEWFGARLCDKMIGLSTGCVEDHVRYRITSREHMTIIPSGVDLSPFSGGAVEHPRLASLPHPRLGTVARLVDIKGITELVEAMATVAAELPDAQLVLAGDGPQREQLEQRVAELKLAANVTFLGEVQDVPAVLAGLDLFVLPSHNEGMGRVIVEAMAFGLPVVASDVGGVPDLVLPHVNGLLVPPKDAPRLAEAILQVLRDPERAKEMGAQGKLHAREFSAEVMFDKLEALCQELAGARGLI